MFNSISRRILMVLALFAMLGVLLVAAPAYADDGSQGATPGVSVAAEGPLINNSAPLAGQRIGWAVFQGAPTIVNGKTLYWVWNENVNGQNTLHIRTTTNGSTHSFTGSVTTGSADNFYNLSIVNAGGTNNATLVGYNQMVFSIATSVNGDGVDVDWSGRWISLKLFMDGYHRPALVLYGVSAKPATRMPLTVLAGTKGLLTLPLSTLDGPTAFQKNIANGYFIYRDAHGYHLRLTTKLGDRAVYKGTIFAEGGQLAKIAFYRHDPADYYRLLNGTALDFRFLTYQGEDGLDWLLTRGGLIFTLKMNGQIAAPNVSLGSNPFGTLQALTFRLVP